jgi:hypothetical protein
MFVVPYLPHYGTIPRGSLARFAALDGPFFSLASFTNPTSHRTLDAMYHHGHGSNSGTTVTAVSFCSLILCHTSGVSRTGGNA